ncbi:MAG: SUMF1/EgtB/PvdO family nonheme iron enzyme [Rhodospirillales bacterium]|nr:SUMF1/EgtB/PvdO family nonheme iron enzyme [Rhodospirillales bacterium]
MAAILAADVEGYSRMMGADEKGTLETLRDCRAIIDSLIARHYGHFVGSAGDSVLAEFASAVDAVECARAIQQEIWVTNAELPLNRRMNYRIGVNLGDIIVDGSNIYGDGVNIASRLEGLADTGGITISGSVFEQVKNKVDFEFDNMGPQRVKNIEDPITVYRMRMTPDDRPHLAISPKIQTFIAGLIVGVLALIFVEATGVYAWLTYYQDDSTIIAASAEPKVSLSAAEAGRLRVSALPRNLSPGTTFQQCADCPAMVIVPAGSFIMGSPDTEKGRHPSEIEGPQHRVTVAKPFAVGQFEVTFRSWDACIAAGGCTQKPQDRGWGRGNRPVIYVSWFDIQKYVRWLSNLSGQQYRLPSEAEWEYFARAGSKTRYWWGDNIGVDKAICLGCGQRFNGSITAPTGSLAQNPFGLYDVHGNVYEWVQDCWNGTYAGAHSDGTAWVNGDCSLRVLRGGAWGKEAENLRSARRIKDPPSLRSGKRGFRVVMTLPK